MSAGAASGDSQPDQEAVDAFAGYRAALRDGLVADLDDYLRLHPGLAARRDDLLAIERMAGEVSLLLGGLFGESAADVTLDELLAPGVSVGARSRGGAQTASAHGLAANEPDFSSRYEVHDVIARGGMGVIERVWDRRLERPLAMKTLKRRGRGTVAGTVDDPEAVARLLEEARITCSLRHPGVVPVHEVGVDDQQRPFFLMAYVGGGEDLGSIIGKVAAGDPDWTMARAVGVIQRIAEAVAHAHRLGILHRDIKPANVLVGECGEEYLIDWGLAQRTGASPVAPHVPDAVPVAEHAGYRQVDDTWLFSVDGKVAGTPAYMAPEQARGEVHRVGRHSDVYSLGALLYHLLAGRPPHADSCERQPVFLVLARARRGPPAPIDEQAPDADPGLLAICRRAMCPEIEGRFASADELARALGEHLEATSEAREEARRQEHRARVTKDFLVHVLGQTAPDRARGRELTVREVLDAAAQDVDRLAEAPLDRALIAAEIGSLYDQLGRHVEAEDHLSGAHERLAALLGPGHRLSLEVATSRAHLHLVRKDFAAAEARLREVMAACGDGHDDDLVIVRARFLLGAVLRARGEGLEEARRLLQDASERRARLLGPAHEETLTTRRELALVLAADPRTRRRGIALLESVVDALQEHLGLHDPRTLVAMDDEARLYRDQGELERAELLWRRVLDLQEEVVGAEHRETINTLNNLGVVLKDQERFPEAERILREAVARQRRSDEDSGMLAILLGNLGRCLKRLGRSAAAGACFEEAERIGRSQFGESSVVTARLRTHLGAWLLERNHGSRERAIAMLESAYAVLSEGRGPRDEQTREAVLALALAYRLAGDPARSQRVSRQGEPPEAPAVGEQAGS